MEFEHVPQQSTHWYSAGGKFSYTADPTRADSGEVERVGLHDCEALGCSVIHWGSSFHYSLWLLRKYFGSEVPEDDAGAQGL
jgi:hypothetical protein